MAGGPLDWRGSVLALLNHALFRRGSCIRDLYTMLCFSVFLFVVVVFLYIDYLYYYSVWMFCTSNEALVRINLILIINVIIRLYIRPPV